MYYVVTRIMTFAGVLYHPGDVLDLGDAELAARMLRETDSAAELIDSAALPDLARPSDEPIAPEEIVAEPEPEPEPEPKSKPEQSTPTVKRRRKAKAG